MNKYMLLLIGIGEGCDYTIACNRKWIELEGCTSMDEAVEMAKTMLVPTNNPDHETSEDLGRISSGRVLEISNSRLLDIDSWVNNKQKEKANQEKLQAHEKDMELIDALKKKYPEKFLTE